MSTLSMALKSSAEALVRYLESVKERGTFNCAHGETLIVSPNELDKHLDAVVNDLLSYGRPAKIKVTAASPVPHKPPPPVFVSARVLVTGASTIG